jgi:RNA polymerase sigma-70 factor (ECF subfamily)
VSPLKRLSRTNEDEKLFEELFASEHQAVYRYCLRRLGSDEAEDAAADVFSVAWRRIGEMPGVEKRRAWLFAVARRVVGNRYRSRERRARLTARIRALATSERTGRGAVTEGTDEVLRALARMRPSDRELLRLSIWEELDRTEIAQVLGIAVNAVDQRLHRARARMRTRLEPLGPIPGNVTPEEASPWSI